MSSRTQLIAAAVLLFGLWKFFTSPSQIEADLGHALIYRTHVVGAASSNDRLPMLIVLHGSGADENDLDSAFAEFSLPLRIVSFRGPARAGRGYTWSRGDGETQAEATIAQRQMFREVGQSLAVGAAEVAARYPTAGKPMVFGFSRGASMAWYLGVYHPEVFAAIFAVAGQLEPVLLKGLAETSRPPIFAYHGRSDSIVGLASGLRTAKEVESAGGRVIFEEFEGGHSVPRSAREDIERKIGSLSGS